MQILKLQQGEPLGLHYSHWRDQNLTDDDRSRLVEEAIEKIKISSELPQSTYNKFLQDIIYLNTRGYFMDPSKASNL